MAADTEKYLRRWGALTTERSSWVDHWREISDFILPRQGRFFTSDRNKGSKRNDKIIDGSGTKALRILAAGMLSGMSSPARPWFRLKTPDEDLNKFHSVQQWNSEVTQMMLKIFSASNTYRTLHTIYGELGGFGTAANLILPNYDNVIHNTALTAGEYCIATNQYGEVDTLYREFDMTIGAMAKMFGVENLTRQSRDAFRRGDLDQWVTVYHAIEPRDNYDSSKVDNKNMPFSSCYFEKGASKNELLRESGFKMFPGFAARWDVSGGDIYGNSPGMDVLGDVKQLQHQQRRKAQAIDYKVNPPLQVPTSLKAQGVNAFPGEVTYVDSTDNGKSIKTMFEVNLDPSMLLQDIQDVRERINSGFYADLFVMLANQPVTSRMTATEVAERHEEKLVMLGPVIERLHNEMLNPLIEVTFYRMLEAGILPPPPKEMQNQPLNVDFVSLLAQAQRAIQTNSIDRFVGNLGAVAQYRPDVIDKFDADAWVDLYADSLGVDPILIVPSDKVAMIRQDRAQQQAQMQQAAVANQQADTANKLAAAKTDQPSALTNVMNMFTGYNN